MLGSFANAQQFGSLNGILVNYDMNRSWGCVWTYLGLVYLSYVYLIVVVSQLRHFMFQMILFAIGQLVAMQVFKEGLGRVVGI